MAEINTRLINGKEQNAELFFQAANYYYTTGRDLKQAAAWASEAEKADKENFSTQPVAKNSGRPERL